MMLTSFRRLAWAGRTFRFGSLQMGKSPSIYYHKARLNKVFGHLSRYYSSAQDPKMIRNVAIIAHVDHGKTSMVDNLLTQSGTLAQHDKEGERVMDSNSLEQERGITIFSKQTSISWKDHHINIVDTPGHGDFGGEVERIMNMVDGVVLLVDASEGPMPQTKFVLGKALKKGLRPIVVLNKLDRGSVRTADVETEIFDLFVELNASDHQLNYPTLYASAKQGWAVRDLDAERKDVTPLLDAIIEAVPAPTADLNAPFTLMVSSIGRDSHLGKILNGRVVSGTVKKGDTIKILTRDGEVRLAQGKVAKVVGSLGVHEILYESGVAGNIVGVVGPDTGNATDTVCALTVNEPLPSDPIDPPVISMYMMVNDSPLAGKAGTKVTAAAIDKRLKQELETNVTLQVHKTDREGAFEIKGRGGLQLSILVENMRREGFEMSISQPRILFKTENDVLYEPLEEVIVLVDSSMTGAVMERLAQRKGELVDVKVVGNKARVAYRSPSRALLGLRTELHQLTRGEAVVHTAFHSYVKHMGDLELDIRTSLISTASGKATSFALQGLEARGTLFIGPGEECYEGMIVGESSKDDMPVNPTKAKHVTNVRSVQKEEFFRLVPPKVMPLEECLTYIGEDELLEVTPNHLRIRKAILSQSERDRQRKKKK